MGSIIVKCDCKFPCSHHLVTLGSLKVSDQCTILSTIILMNAENYAISRRNAFPVTLLSYSGYKETPFYNEYVISGVGMSGNCFTA